MKKNLLIFLMGGIITLLMRYGIEYAYAAGYQVAPVPVTTATYNSLKSRLQSAYGGVFEELQPDGSYRLLVDIVPTTGGDHLSFYKKD